MPVITYSEALRQALREAMTNDPRVFIIGEDVVHYDSAYGVTKGFEKEFGPDRIKDMPIAEAGYAGLGIGAAMNGLRPIVEMMTTNFAILALDMIINHAAKLHYMFGGQFTCPIVFRMPNGYGQLSATHSQAFDNYYAYMPGLKVVVPGTPYDAKGLDEGRNRRSRSRDFHRTHWDLQHQGRSARRKLHGSDWQIELVARWQRCDHRGLWPHDSLLPTSS